MVADNPGMPAGNDNTAAKIAADLEAALKNHQNEAPALDRWRQEVYRRTDPKERQAFVDAVQQQLLSSGRGYHVPEATLSSTPQTGAQAARPRTEAHQQSQLQAPRDLVPAEYRQHMAQTDAARTQVPPNTQSYRHTAPAEQTPRDSAAQIKEADRIAKGALELKQQGGDTAKVQDYIKKETTGIYKQHPEWMNAASPKSFIHELNQQIKQEHLWEHGSARRGSIEQQTSTESTERPHAQGTERTPHARSARTEHTREYESTHTKFEHAHALLEDDEHKKLAADKKITDYTLPGDAKHPKAVSLRELAKENLPPEYRTPANIDQRLKALEELNKVKSNSYFNTGDKLWMYTAPPEAAKPAPHAAEASPPPPIPSESDLPKPPAPPKAAEAPPPPIPSESDLPKPPATDVQPPVAVAPVPPPAEVKPTPPSDADRAADDKRIQAEVTDYLAKKVPPDAKLGLIRSALKEADDDVDAGKANKGIKLVTRQALVMSLVDTEVGQAEGQNKTQNLTAAKEIVKEMQLIDPTIMTRTDWSDFQQLVRENKLQ